MSKKHFSAVVIRLFSIDERLVAYGLRGRLRAGKAMVEYGNHLMSPGTMVWDCEVVGGPIDRPGGTKFVSLHVVVWVKSWNNHDREMGRKALIKFREATEAEHALETVMNE